MTLSTLSPAPLMALSPTSAMMLSPAASVLFSTGRDVGWRLTIEVLRTVENAHESRITAASYNEELDLVATGDDAGNVHIYDLQKLYLLFSCCGHAAEILSLSSAAILLSSDADGRRYGSSAITRVAARTARTARDAHVRTATEILHRVKRRAKAWERAAPVDAVA
ncbi:hypothetical protein ATCC90586_003753 [Pythium insidiosum]|nr:hypothetical protein ATCC90586_003753 [Pythium insidiosum]